MVRRALSSVAMLLAAAALPAVADSSSTTVSLAAIGPGTRQLDLLDVTGQPLTELPLTPGVPSGFRVRIADDQISDLTAGFTVTAVMSNLYRSNGAGGYVWSDRIGSGDVHISYPANPFNALGISYDALPKVDVTGTLPNCPALAAATGVSLTTLTATGLCTIVGVAGNGYTLPTPISASTVLNALISGAVRAPYDLTGNESGIFGTPSYAVGIGAAAVGNDPGAVANQAGSARSVMVGQFTGVSNLLADINGVLAGLTGGLADTSITGSGAYTKVSDVLTALSDQGQSALSNAIASLPAGSAQVAVLSQLTFGLAGPTVAELAKEIGTYNAFPMLKVAPSQTVSTGTYQGTLTVTMIQP